MFNELFKNKIKLILFLFIVTIVVVVIVFASMSLMVVHNSSDEKYFKDEYTKLNNVATADGKKYPRVNITNDNRVKYVNYNDVINLLNNMGDAVVYFGYAECLYCRTAVQVLIDTVVDTDIEEIYYINVQTQGELSEELISIIGEKFVDTADGSRKIYAPLVLFIADGNVVSYNKGTLFSQKDPYTELDASQIKGLSEIYSYGIKDVLNAMKND